MAKNIYEEVTQTLDKETGEVETIERKIKRKVKRDLFAMMYVEEIANLISNISPAEMKVLIAIVQRSEYNTNRIFLTKGVKDRIVNDTKLKYSTVHNSVSKLSQKDILIRETTSEYILNPKYFFKGEEVERAKVIKFIIEYRLED
jgi:DNA-binding MarR family transcriptional regulator